jgi:hypothetical protein
LHPWTAKPGLREAQIDLFTGAVFPLGEEVDFSFTTRLDITPDTIRATPLLSY